MEDINIGIDQEHRAEIAQGLKHLLADSYTLYLQTHNFHWNVTGPQFRDLHLLFEEHYTELAVAVDDIAERIRTLGVYAPGTYQEFAELSSIEEVHGVRPIMPRPDRQVDGDQFKEEDEGEGEVHIGEDVGKRRYVGRVLVQRHGDHVH